MVLCEKPPWPSVVKLFLSTMALGVPLVPKIKKKWN
jgi:hypothetical protein